MTSQTSLACPRCRAPLTTGTRFCGQCGNDISGVWSASGSHDPAAPGASAPGYSGPTVIEDVAQDALAALLVDATLGEYDVYGELGRGGMAAVYLALDLALNRKVAIKTMLPDLVSREGMVQRFRREAQTAAALNHPHVIQIYTVKQSKQLVYFVMKYIEGRSLESVVAEHGHLTIGMTQTILGQVGSALDYAHRKGVVHRDVKPANIMIDEDGWAIVTDFGIAKVQEAQNLTATGTAIGTPHYMSPEQFHNKAVTGRSDQYSLGVVAYEMLTGRKPFDGSTYAEILTKHLFEAVPDPREIRAELPGHVGSVLAKMMAKEPADRYPDLDAAIAALGAPPSKSEGDVVRTQMMTIAKSGPEKKVRMSVPVSPIPLQKQQGGGTVLSAPADRGNAAAAAPAAPTVIKAEPKKPTRPRPEVRPETPKRRRGLTIALTTVVVLAAAAYGAFRLNLLPIPGIAARNAASPQQAGTPAAPAADTTVNRADSSSAPVDTGSVAAVVPDSSRRSPAAVAAPPVARTDSADRARVEAERARFVRDSTAHARAVRDSIARAREIRDSLARVERRRQDSIAAAHARPGSVKLASRTPGAALYIDGALENLLGSPRDVQIPSNTSVRISIRAPSCEPWDTVVKVAPGSATTIGYRSAKCH